MYSHALVGPLIKLGVDGLLRYTNMLLVGLVPQLFTACTVMLLEVKPDVNVTTITVSFSPNPFGWLTDVVFACEFQMYEAAPDTFEIV